MGEAKRRKQIDPSFGQSKQLSQNFRLAGYVVFFEQRFLCVRRLNDGVLIDRWVDSPTSDDDNSVIDWCDSPKDAAKFDSLASARTMAWIVAGEKAAELNQEVKLLVQSLFENETQFVTRDCEWAFANPSPIVNNDEPDHDDNVGSYDSIMESFGGEDGFFEEFGCYP